MAWIPTTQFEGAFPGGKIEWGYITLTTATKTVEVATHMSKVNTALVSYKEAPDAATLLHCDGVVTAGAVTVTGTLGVGSNDRVFCYVFIGT